MEHSLIESATVVEVTPEAAPLPRLAVVDALRGAALFGMFVYHFAWDLVFFGLIGVDVGSNLGWRLFAHIVASTFLGLVGVSLVLATRNGFRPNPFFRRFLRIALAAAAVSLVSFGLSTVLGEPDLFIYFGILHSIAVASLIALLFLRAPAILVAVAAAALIVAPDFLRSFYFDDPHWWWLGLSYFVAPTVDYVPVLPWAGATLLGILVGRWIVAAGRKLPLLGWSPTDPVGKTLVFGGRWSLLIYLLHQPVLFGIAWLIAYGRGPV